VGLLFSAALDAVNHDRTKSSGGRTVIYGDPGKHDSVKREGGWNDPKLKPASFALKPFDDVIDVEFQVACAVLSLNESECVNVIVVPRRRLEVCVG
jgi:hypothetical protein